MEQQMLTTIAKGMSLPKQRIGNTKSNNQVYRYLKEFQSTCSNALINKYALSLKLIPFKGGKLIDARVVDKERATIEEVAKVKTVQEALSIAGYDLSKMKNSETASPKGTFFFFRDNQITMVKDNSYQEWKKYMVNKDVNNIIYKIIKNTN